MRLLGDGQFRVAALEREPAVGEAKQPGDDAQQRGFSRAVAAGDGQSLAGRRRKSSRRRKLAAAAVTGQIDSG